MCTLDSNYPATECIPRSWNVATAGDVWRRFIREHHQRDNGKDSSYQRGKRGGRHGLRGDSLSCISSSLRFSTEDDDDEYGGGLNERRKGKTFEELAKAVIREIREVDEERGKRLEGMNQRGEPSRQAAGVNNEDPHEGLIREMINLTRMDDEADAEEDEWRKTLEETVDTLVVEVAEQREQMARLVNLMERVVSWMDRETQSSNNPSPAT